jgi:integrase
MKYASHFCAHITGLIEQKQAIGHKYIAEANLLRRFDAFCIRQHPHEHDLTKDLVEQWATRTPTESTATLSCRLTPIRQLALYMNRLGIEAYVFPIHRLPKIPPYTPYIFNDGQLTGFFAACDQCHAQNEVPLRHVMMPVFFRLLYCCGLRVSEARLLKRTDVDLSEGVITVYETKWGKDRRIPLSSDMAERCVCYAEQAHLAEKETDYFFPRTIHEPVTLGNAYKNFRKFLWQAGISHGGRGKGPRIHDFRHTFAVHCLRKWVLEGKDLNAWLPVLKTYMGHYSFLDTAYYLRLTADLYPHIIRALNAAMGELIPRLKEDGNENN